MEDTTGPVSREVVVTCGLFLVILVVGTIAFDLYTRPDNSIVITGAAVAETTGQKSNASNSITGGVIGISGAVTYEDEPSYKETLDPQIGVYSISPSLSFVDEYGLVDEYTSLQQDIRNFASDVEDCRTNDDLDNCFDKVLPEYNNWMLDCETSEEAVFYDFTEMFNQCLASEDADCLCINKFSYSPNYDYGEYYIDVVQDGFDVAFSLVDTDVSTTIHNMEFQIEDENKNYDEYTISVDKSMILGSFLYLDPSSTVYLHKKDENIISVESQTSFSTYEYTRDYCAIQETGLYKLCVQSDTFVQVYDDIEDKVIEQPVVYTFALDFE